VAYFFDHGLQRWTDFVNNSIMGQKCSILLGTAAINSDDNQGKLTIQDTVAGICMPSPMPHVWPWRLMLSQPYPLKSLQDMTLAAFKQLSRDTLLFQIANGITGHTPY
jgi:hypothetical protein